MTENMIMTIVSVELSSCRTSELSDYTAVGLAMVYIKVFLLLERSCIVEVHTKTSYFQSIFFSSFALIKVSSLVYISTIHVTTVYQMVKYIAFVNVHFLETA